jgi:uracil-DNA glycosylase
MRYERRRTEFITDSLVIFGHDSYLSSWAKSGVLLLNTSLTVRAHQAGSHSGKGWEEFTDAVVRIVDQYGGAGLGENRAKGVGNGVVFLCWGAWAAKRVAKLDKRKHLILTSPVRVFCKLFGISLTSLSLSLQHPSPLSAHRGYLGNGHFKKANEWLREKYGEGSEIDWCKLELPSPADGTP